MATNQRVSIDPRYLLTDGIHISKGEITDGALDGLDFVYVSRPNDLENPLLVMSDKVAAFGLFQLAAALSWIHQRSDNELLKERLSLITDLAHEVAEIVVQPQPEDSSDGSDTTGE